MNRPALASESAWPLLSSSDRPSDLGVIGTADGPPPRHGAALIDVVDRCFAIAADYNPHTPIGRFALVAGIGITAGAIATALIAISAPCAPTIVLRHPGARRLVTSVALCAASVSALGLPALLASALLAVTIVASVGIASISGYAVWVAALVTHARLRTWRPCPRASYRHTEEPTTPASGVGRRPRGRPPAGRDASLGEG